MNPVADEGENIDLMACYRTEENGNAERKILLPRPTLFLMKWKKLNTMHVKFEVLTAVTLNITLCSVVALFSLVDMYQCHLLSHRVP
jgi:hypothetical protein